MPRDEAGTETGIAQFQQVSAAHAKLLKAAKSCQPAAIRAFLEAGGSPDATTELVCGAVKVALPLLHSAVIAHHGKHKGNIKILLDAGANINLAVLAPDNNDRTALMAACDPYCCIEPIDQLLKAGADPCLQSTSDGDTALHIAAKRGHTAVCKKLLQAGGARLLHKINCFKQTPMSPAVSGGSVEVVQLLHEQGALLNPPDNKLFNSLHTAALKKRLPVLRYLLDNGAAADVNALNYSKVTAIALASYNNSVEMVQLLLQYGADPAIPNDGATALSA
jgi:Ankyrin repeats (3 copies)/Ankyrin repeats (many copies)